MVILVGVILAVASYPFIKIFARWHEVNAHIEAAREADEREAAAREAYANRPLVPDETARLQNIAPKLHDTIASFEDEWHAATTPDALHDVTTLLRACPIAVKSPSFDAGDRYVTTGTWSNGVELEFARVSTGTAIAGPDFRAMLASADAIAKRVAAGSLARKDFAAANELYAPDEPVKFLATLEDKPPIAGGDTYASGHVIGTAYVYDLALGAIVCAGKIDVENSPGITFDNLRRGDWPAVAAALAERKALERDLEVRTQRAIAKALGATTSAR